MVKVANVAKVVLEPDKVEIPFETEGDYIRFKVPEIKYMSMVRMIIK